MTLLLPPRLTTSARALSEEATRRGIPVVQLPNFVVPAGLRADHVHAGPSFVDAVAGPLGITALEAPPDWLTRLPRDFTGRVIEAMSLRQAYNLHWPAFVKSPNDKNVPARIYSDGSHLPGPDAVDPQTLVLVSEIVIFEEEHRLHILDASVRTGSRYAELGRLSLGPLSPDALAFATDLLAETGHTIPSAIVIDVGLVADRWIVIEANAAWGSGHYTGDVAAVLDVVLRAALPDSQVHPTDHDFARTHAGAK